jgi:5'-nucleotidase
LGVLEIMKDRPPDLLVSGINHGPNLGDDVTYSGTVSAALEGALLGVPSIAFSLASANGEVPNYAPAATFATKFVARILETSVPKGVIFNVNVPNVSGEEISDYEFTRLGRRRYASAIKEKIDPRGKKYYWIGADELDFDDIPGSDSNAIRMNKISITPIRLDFTHDQYLQEFRTWRL